jgi:hypothetical protein
VKLHLPRVEVRLPPIEEVAENWPLIAKLLRKATVITGCYEPIDLLAMAMRGQVGIWVCEVADVVKAAIVTEIKQYPRRRVLEVMFTGGSNMRDWLSPAIDALDEHARQAGCEHIATIGRPGWARAWGGELTGNVLIVRGLKDQR